MVKKKEPIVGVDFRTVDVSRVEVLAPTKYFGLQSKLDEVFTIQTPKMNLDRMTIYDNFGSNKVYLNLSQPSPDGTICHQFSRFLRNFEEHVARAVADVWAHHGDPDSQVLSWSMHSVKSEDEDHYLALTLPLTMRTGNITTPLAHVDGALSGITWDNILFNTPIALVIKPGTVWYRQCREDPRNGVYGVKWQVLGAKSYTDRQPPQPLTGSEMQVDT